MSRMQDGENGRDGPGATRFDRRNFLKVVGTGAAAAGALVVPAAAQMEMPQHGVRTAQAGSPPVSNAPTGGAQASQIPNQTYRFLNTDEGDFVQSAVDTLIPADSAGPGALELGVANFIDGQLNGGYGNGERLYIQGPFPEGATPEQGYQLPMTPAELMRAGMLDVRTYCTNVFGKSFAELSANDRDTVLHGLESDEIKLATVPAKVFFEEFLKLTVDGYFADPMYGGNRDAAAWKMIGFPGANAMYTDKIAAYRNKLYPNQPEGIDQLV